MLHLIYGRAGFGKSHELYRIIEQLPEDANPILLVPEQYSFESERAMLGLPIGRRAEVVSFSRLCQQVFREYGGGAGIPLGTVEKQLLVSRAIHQVADRLQIYRRQAGHQEFTTHVLSVLSELSYAGVSAERLVQIANELPASVLRNKMKELALIASAYEALKADSYQDPDGDLERLQQVLAGKDYWCNKTVLIDSFKGFTVPQMELVKQMAASAKDVYLTVCADSSDQRYAMDVFANTKELAKELRRYVLEGKAELAPSVFLSGNHRAANPSMKALEQVLADCETDISSSGEEITLCQCEDRYDEAEFVAGAICRLVREEGYRYRDIAVMARNGEEYYDLLADLFARYGIPCFIDRRRSIAYQPLTAYLLKGVSLAVKGWDSDEILSFIKTGLAGLSTEEIAALENYVFVWGVKGGQWLYPFEKHPDGMTDQTPDATVLVELNQLRKKTVNPLDRLAVALNDCHTVKDFATVVYEFLERQEVYNQLQGVSARLTEAGDVFEAEDVLRCFDVVVTMLDSLVASVGDLTVSKEEFLSLLQTAAGSADMGKIPQGIDQVAVGSADRMRPSSPKAVFLLGVNQGVFPATPASGGLLTDRERLILRQNNIPVSDHTLFDAVEERFLFYAAANCASHRAFLTYLTTDGEKELAPATELELLKKRISCVQFRAGEWEKAYPLSRTYGVLPAFDLLAARYHDGSALTQGLYRYFAQYQPERLQVIKQLTEVPDCRLQPETARELFGSNITISPSGVEVYHKCAFSYFCQYGLRVTARKPVALDVLSRGTMVHHVLEKMIQLYGSKGLHQLNEQQLKANVHELLYEYVEQSMGGISDKAGIFRFQLERMELLLVSLISHMAEELKESYFATVACECEIKRNGDIPPLCVPLPNGGSLTVRGTVDRIDTYQKDDTTYFRVVDYKTGVKTFQLDDLYHGIGLQMLIYLLAVEKNGELIGENRVPAGVLYMPARRVSIRTDGDTSNLQKELAKTLQMKGLVADDPIIIEAMDPKANGIYMPFSHKKSGVSGSLASLSFFGKIGRQIEELLYQMGENLQRGNITCDPLDPVGGDACGYCGYRAVCPLNGEKEHRQVPVLTAEQEKELLQGGDYHELSN
ncbi:MAG: PD-(D/E)XK nuclease family protein [Clostridia bacterium]|nr:PD-(D/E)XK nuclease family protein [Clostridia bacterium]